MNNLQNKDGLTEEEFLKGYTPKDYEKPSVTTDVTIFTIDEEEPVAKNKKPNKKLQILLIQRNNHPYMNHWALPGGFANMDESLDETAKRELQEETGIENIYMEQLYTWGGVDRDPRMRVISTSYLSLIDKGSVSPKANSDADNVGWFDVSVQCIEEKKIEREGFLEKIQLMEVNLKNEDGDNDTVLRGVVQIETIVKGSTVQRKMHILEQEGIAFDHAKIILYSLERLKNKVNYTNIAFNLLPEKFDLTELQQVFETILEEKFTAANFRRKVNDMVVETKEYKKEGAHRPSKYYRYNIHWQN